MRIKAFARKQKWSVRLASRAIGVVQYQIICSKSSR
ncbi:hypothetical protein SY94_4043 [Agrobacterium tumefaciens]|nr:hypothetical protein SY94_4043 [Agrobacterium tumefaciens]